MTEIANIPAQGNSTITLDAQMMRAANSDDPARASSQIQSWIPAAARTAACLLCYLLFAPHAEAFDVDAAKLSVPRILVKIPKGHESGSGFIVHSESDYCIVATNYHVVADFVDSQTTPMHVFRKVQDGIESRTAELILVDKDMDLALLKVPGMQGQPLTLLTVEPPQADDVYSIGFPGIADDKENRMAIYQFEAGGDGVHPDPEGKASMYVEASVSKGVVRRIVTAHWYHLPTTVPLRIIQHDVNIGHGNSGGPLFNNGGQVIGVNTATRSRGASLDVDKFSESSHIAALIGLLKKQDISFLSADTVSRTADAATGLATTTTIVNGGSSVSTYLMVGVGGLAVFALLIALRKRESLVESYSHFARRKSAAAGSRIRQNDDEGGNSAPTTPPEHVSFKHGTVSSSGAFVLEGKDPDDRSQIRLTADDAVWKKAGERILIGRSGKQSHLCIRNKSVSGEHFSVLRHDTKFLVEDRDSSNGTSINGKKLVPFAPMPIEDGDLLQVGDVLLRFRTTDGNARKT